MPLLGSILALGFGRFIGKSGAQMVTTGGTATAFFLSIFAFYEVGLSGAPTHVQLFTWMDSELFHCDWGLLVDPLTVCMLIVVTSVSTLVHCFSIGYMSADPHIPRFMAYLSLFTFFMLVLVTADNFLQLFVGWEGVGLCSYLLINFWFTRLQANKAAIKAMIVNRCGDLGLALGMVGVYYLFKAVDFSTVFASASSFSFVGQESALAHELVSESFGPVRYIFCNLEWDFLTLVCCLLFVGSVGKSAQLGLHTWLPDAMEGPTPVSALIHAATMVTAGVFLLIRCSPLFEYAPNALLVVTFFGAMTAFFAASVGLVQSDLKKVIAYSTCSQLGYMVFACGLSNYHVGLFHLANHAFFKALLFLSAGCVIHAIGDEQDMRKMGGLLQLIPYTYAMMMIGSLSLMGFPFLTGFYSKDVILELAFAKYTMAGSFAHWLGTLAAFFTAFYSFRLLYLTFIGGPNGQRVQYAGVHDAPFWMAAPLNVLAFGSIFIGYLTRDMIIGLGSSFWGSAIFIHPAHLIIIDSEFIPAMVKNTPVFFSLLGASSALVMYHFFGNVLFAMKTGPLNPADTGSAASRLGRLGNKMYNFLVQKWFFDKVYNEFVAHRLMGFGYHTSFRLLDKGLFEMLGPYGISRAVVATSEKVARVQTGYIFNYAFVMLLGVTFLVTLVALGSNTGMVHSMLAMMDYKLSFIFLLLIGAFL